MWCTTLSFQYAKQFATDIQSKSITNLSNILFLLNILGSKDLLLKNLNWISFFYMDGYCDNNL